VGSEKLLVSQYLPKFRTWFSSNRNASLIFAGLIGIIIGIGVVAVGQFTLLLFVLVSGIVFLLSLYYKEAGLVVLVFTSYTRFSDILIEYNNLPSFAKPLLAFLILSILVRWAIFREAPKGWESSAILFGLLSIASLGSLIYSPAPDRVLVRLIDDLKDTIIAIVVVVLLQSNFAFRRTTWTLILVGVFLGSLTVFQYITKSFDNVYGGFAISLQHQIVGEIDDYRATGPMEDPNFFAQIIVVLIPISFERFLHEKTGILRLIALYSAGICIFTVILTYSRGGLLAMIVALAVLLFVYPPKRKYVPVILFSTLLVMYMLPPNYLDRLFALSSFFRPGNSSRVEELSLEGRLSENLTALEMFKSHPVFGIGLNTYSYLFPVYSKNLGLALVATERDAHNIYLEVIAEMGLVGFIIFSLVLVSAFRSIMVARKIFLILNDKNFAGMCIGYFAGMVGYFTAAAFIHNGYPRFFYLILGIAFSLNYVRRDHQNEYLMGIV